MMTHPLLAATVRKGVVIHLPPPPTPIARSHLTTLERAAVAVAVAETPPPPKVRTAKSLPRNPGVVLFVT